MSTSADLFALIARVLPDGGNWCTQEKAAVLASLVLGLRPRCVVEIGVWMGGSLIPMALAMDRVRKLAPNHGGLVIGIDPWSATESSDGESGDNLAWWSSVDHEQAFRLFDGRLDTLGLRACVSVDRRPSDAVEPPERIDLLHIDGNHTEQALRDARRFLARVPVGGIAILDDVGWEGGGVSQGLAHALEIGFVQLYPLDAGVVLQRRARVTRTERPDLVIVDDLAAPLEFK